MKTIFKVKLIMFLFCYKEIYTNTSNRVSTIPPNLSLYKYEGNFYPAYASRNVNPNEFQGYVRTPRYLNQVELNYQVYHNDRDKNEALPSATGSDPQTATEVQPLQQVSSSGKQTESVTPERNLKITTMSPEKRSTDELQYVGPSGINSVTRHYHDIYVKLKSPQDLVFGHVLSWPGLAQKKIEKRTGNNNYKGQVIWADKKGGYGEHYWDLAQGAI